MAMSSERTGTLVALAAVLLLHYTNAGVSGRVRTVRSLFELAAPCALAGPAAVDR